MKFAGKRFWQIIIKLNFQHADQCLEDLDLVFDNCFKFYKSDTAHWKAAKKLEIHYLHKLKGMPLQEVAMEDAVRR